MCTHTNIYIFVYVLFVTYIHRRKNNVLNNWRHDTKKHTTKMYLRKLHDSLIVKHLSDLLPRIHSMFVSACDVLVSFCLDFGVLVFSVYFRCFGFSRVRVCLFLVPRILPTNLFPSIGLRNNNSLQYYSIGRARTHTHAPALGLSRIHDMICYSISRAPACYGLPVILCITHTHEGQAAEQRI